MRTRFAIVLCVLCACPALVWAQQPLSKGLAEAVRAEAASLTRPLSADPGAFEGAADALDALLVSTARRVSRRELDLLPEIDGDARIARLLARLPEGRRTAMFASLAAAPDLRGELAFLIDPVADDVAGAFDTVRRLLEDHGEERVERYAGLAAAIAVVHDGPFHQRINENVRTAVDPVELFGYFTKHAGRLRVDPAGLPAELLIYVVDSTATPAEMSWSLSEYARDGNLGNRFFEIKYDRDHYLEGADKAVTAAGGYSLQSIKRHGGVCADQAYFAMTVGKSIGVPSAYVYGRSAEVSHAWVGFLEIRGRRARWNFDEGRYEAYQGVRGNIRDPQTRRVVFDGVLALRASAAQDSKGDRRTASAVARAVLVMNGPELAVPEALAAIEPLRGCEVADRLELLELGLRRCPASAEGWSAFERIARSGQVDERELDAWLRVLDRLCGSDYPDFSMDLYEAVIGTVEDPARRSGMWDWVFNRMSRRPDLAAVARFHQGALWQEAGDLDKAWKAYDDVVRRFPNDGPMIVDALRSMERLLDRAGKSNLKVGMYERAFKSLEPPRAGGSPFRAQSNWFRVGKRYATLLHHDSQAGKAERIAEELGLAP